VELDQHAGARFIGNLKAKLPKSPDLLGNPLFTQEFYVSLGKRYHATRTSFGLMALPPRRRNRIKRWLSSKFANGGEARVGERADPAGFALARDTRPEQLNARSHTNVTASKSGQLASTHLGNACIETLQRTQTWQLRRRLSENTNLGNVPHAVLLYQLLGTV
jgi:hypothetical protein